MTCHIVLPTFAWLWRKQHRNAVKGLFLREQKGVSTLYSMLVLFIITKANEGYWKCLSLIAFIILLSSSCICKFEIFIFLKSSSVGSCEL